MDEGRGFEHLQKPLRGGGLFNEEPDYLEYNYRGRPYSEKLFFNAGLSYMGGSVAGFVFGGYRGLAAAPSGKFKVRMNGLLNGAGKYGSRAGNGAGVLALFYTSFEKLVDMSGADELVGEAIPYFNQVTAGTATGMLYKCTARPTTMLLAGAVGGVGVGALSFAEYWWNTSRF